jgi:hypothetical protein
MTRVAAKTLHDFEHAGSKKNRDAPIGHVPEKRLECTGGQRVNTLKGFIEKQDAWTVRRPL